MRSRTFAAGLVLLAVSAQAGAGVIFGNTGLANGSRWDASARTINGLERSLDGGLRYSLQGGSYQAYRDLFQWQGPAPSVADFTNAVQSAFQAWTVVDPVSGLGTSLKFVADFSTTVVGTGSGGVNTAGAEIDLLATTRGQNWGVGDTGQRGETYFNTSSFTTLSLTSGTTGYSGFAISGADVTLNNNSGALYSLPVFQTLLTHEIGHAIGLGDVDFNPGRFIDDNYNGATSASALATLTNSWAALVNPLNPSASALALYSVANGDPGVDTAGVNILMESAIPGALIGSASPLQNDDFGTRQFLYPTLAVPEPHSVALMLGGLLLLVSQRRRLSARNS